ncbi:MAG: T9SS type A sorting domain-containing protein [Ginsengibacter sp.]
MYKKIFLFSVFLIGITLSCFAQDPVAAPAACVNPVVTISADYCTSAGKVILTAQPSSGVTYLWNTGDNTESITVDVVGAYSVTATTISGGCKSSATMKVGNELVVNGDFTAGNTGFISGYAYKEDIPNYNQELVDDTGNNAYAVGTSGQNYHPSFFGMDHTNNQTGPRNFMLVNGHGNITVWEETVKVEPNTNYYYSAWAMNLNPTSPARLQFEVNGEKIGTIADLTNAPKPTSSAAVNLTNWVRFYNGNSAGWNSGSATTAVIRIVDLNSAANGNDFGLDDISFATLSPFIAGPQQPGTDNQSVCPKNNIQPIVYTVGSGGPPSVTGLPAGIGYTFDGVTLTISGASSVPGTYNYKISTTGCAVNKSASGVIVIKDPATWNGSADKNWNNPGNWPCGIIPGATTDVIIPSGLTNYPVITSSVGYSGNVTIQTGASITIANGGILKIGGNIYNSGKFDATKGSIEMNGASQQTISGSIFYQKSIWNLIVSNSSSSGLTVSSTSSDTLKILGTLSFGNAASKFNTGDNLTLVSNATGTARVDVVGPGNSINGKVIVERYINLGTAPGQHAKSWQFLATPTNGQTVKQSWMENGNTPSNYGTQITGAGGTAAGFDLYSSTPSLKYYNYATDSWIGVANTNNPVFNANGYMIFVRGDRSVTAFDQPAVVTTLRTKGSLLTGTQAAINVNSNNMESIGNPYASPIDFTKLTIQGSIDNKFYVWDPYLYGFYGLGGYQTLSAVNNWKPVPGGTFPYPSGISSSIIQSGQAFFVHSTTDVASFSKQINTVTFTENCKVPGTGSVNFARKSDASQNRNFLGVSLFTGPADKDIIADGNMVIFDPAFSNIVDGNDAIKISNAGENFGLKRDGKILSIEAKAPVTTLDTLYYNMTNLAQRTYQLRFAPENMSAVELQAFLIDKFLNTSTPVSLNDSSFVTFAVTSNAASAAADRFKIIFRQMDAMPVTFISIKAVQKNQYVVIQWNMENESGIQQYEIEKSADGINFVQAGKVAALNKGAANYDWTDEQPFEGNNYYRIHSVSPDGKNNYTQIVKVMMGKITAKISVYPNPVTDGFIHLQFKNQLPGIYTTRLFNPLGQLISSDKISVTERSSEEFISMNHLPKGIYQLEIVKPDGNTQFIKIIK